MRVRNLVEVPVDLSTGAVVVPGELLAVPGMDDPHDAWLVAAGLVEVVEDVKPKAGKPVEKKESE